MLIKEHQIKQITLALIKENKITKNPKTTTYGSIPDITQQDPTSQAFGRMNLFKFCFKDTTKVQQLLKLKR